MTASSNSSDAQGTSTRPYLIRALHDWCIDNGFTPYLAVYVDGAVRVPMEYVRNNEIVLNVGFEATSGLKLGNEFIEFKARFGGVPRDIMVPVDHVVAIYARENGQGMAFPMPSAADDDEGDEAVGQERPSRGLRLAGPEDRSTGALPTGGTPVLAVAPSVMPPAAADVSDADVAPVVAQVLAPVEPTDPEPPATAPGGGRPSLKRIK